MVVLHDLQVEEAREKATERDQHEHTGKTQPAPEEEYLALRIAQFLRAEAAVAPAVAGAEEQAAGHSGLG
jgi:hypothetical protein